MAMHEMIDILEEQIQCVSKSMKKMTVGSEEHTKATEALCDLFRQRNEAQKNETTMIDLAEKRNDQRAFNEAELDIRRVQLENENDRKELDVESRRLQHQMDMRRLIADRAMDLLKITAYTSLTKRAFIGEQNGWMQPRPSTTKYIEPIMKR